MPKKPRKKRGGRTQVVRGHVRSPRGPNAGKKAVRVKRYRRRPSGGKR